MPFCPAGREQEEAKQKEKLTGERVVHQHGVLLFSRQSAAIMPEKRQNIKLTLPLRAVPAHIRNRPRLLARMFRINARNQFMESMICE
jgi:hypothetical protein